MKPAPLTRLLEFLVLLAAGVLTVWFVLRVMCGPRWARWALRVFAPVVAWVAVDYCRRRGVALVGTWPLAPSSDEPVSDPED